ncbi:MAG: hypothetical protein JO072_06265 [Parafilimonas sp.]|nr:hypothetical protein [Parafilimonas sp.]
MTILFVETYSLISLAGTAIASFGAGLLFKMAVVAKQRKRILSLEDEMLSNHSRILELEKKVTETRPEKNGAQHPEMTPIKTDRELRAS